MRYLRHVPRRFKSNFREGCTVAVRWLCAYGMLYCGSAVALHIWHQEQLGLPLPSHTSLVLPFWPSTGSTSTLVGSLFWVSILFLLQFTATIFHHSTSSFMFEVYFWLLIFLGYMIYDTEEIIERVPRGNMYYIKHTLNLFTDFVAVLVRILI